MNFGQMYVRLPRKNTYKMLETDQANVIKMVTQKRNELKRKTRYSF